MVKNWLPLGGATVTESASEPGSLMVKDFVWVRVWLARLILSKLRLFGVTASLLTAGACLASPMFTCAYALTANRIVAVVRNAMTA
jgi:hypothetical protein